MSFRKDIAPYIIVAVQKHIDRADQDAGVVQILIDDYVRKCKTPDNLQEIIDEQNLVLVQTRDESIQKIGRVVVDILNGALKAMQRQSQPKRQALHKARRVVAPHAPVNN